VASMIAGNFISLWIQMAACMQRGLYPSVKWLLAVPLYWGLMSVAAFKAFGQLLNPRLRHHWEKTTHGLVADVGAQKAVAVSRQPGSVGPLLDTGIHAETADRTHLPT